MAMNKETATVFGITVDAKYSYSPAFKFFVVGNAVVSAYVLLSIPFVLILCSKTSSPSSYFFLFLFDQMLNSGRMGIVSCVDGMMNSLEDWISFVGQ
ncbi:CASP-like protein 1F1 [Magnolia sinica]|uniref:CASP-like protein 1F1 n=1 Tax=Magnolia sinica TaxID=86752 RepID=UPI00265A3A43|nr:CASP-like protein 1F1 [Magnolia sinica]